MAGKKLKLAVHTVTRWRDIANKNRAPDDARCYNNVLSLLGDLLAKPSLGTCQDCGARMGHFFWCPARKEI